MVSVTLFTETAQSRDAVIDLRAGSTTFNYLALVNPPYDVSDDQDIIAYCFANLPPRYGYQQLRNVTTKGLGGPVWEVAATYGFDEGDAVALPPGDPLSYEFSCDTTGGTQHITQSLATSSSTRYGVPVNQRTVNDLVTVGPRAVNDAVTNAGLSTLTSATAAFTSADVGAVLSSTTAGMLPVSCTIAQVLSATQVRLSSAALATVSGGNLTISSVILSSATAAFTQADVGAAVTSTTANVLPAGATIAGVLSSTRAQIKGGTILSSQAAANLTIGALAAVNYGRAIGVSRDGVAGTDIVAPKLELQISRNFMGMTLDYVATLHRLTGKTNNAPFFGFPQGELLFVGGIVTPSQNNQAAAAPLARVNFRFAGSPNRNDIDLVPPDASGNPLLRVPAKKGWEYLWVFYKDDLDPVSNTIRPRPESAYVEQVYEEADFGQLLIGTS